MGAVSVTGQLVPKSNENLYPFQGFSLVSALVHSPKIAPDVREFAVQIGQLSETIFGSAHCTVMHSDAIVFLFYLAKYL